MTLDELVAKLQEMYENAPYGEKPVSVVRFAIEYASELERWSNAAVARAAHLTPKDSYSVEIGYGRKLAKYVNLKANNS